MNLLQGLLVAAFWLSLAVWPLAYLVYPAVLLAISRLHGDLSLAEDLPWPTVVILVAAHNEERTIEACLTGCLAQEYPGAQPTIVVGLDGCTDRTAEIVGSIGDSRVSAVEFARQGKAATQNALVQRCSADVIAMTDAGGICQAGALTALVRPFLSSRVGCTGGVFRPRPTGEGSVTAEASYFALEYRLMRAESELGILSKASGLVQAFRRPLWRPTPLTSDADISLPALIAVQGSLVRFAPNAVVMDDGPRDLKTVFRARRRMATQTLVNVPRHIVALARAGFWGHAASLTFHKLLRWLAPLAGLLSIGAAILMGLLGHFEYLALLTGSALAGLAALVVMSLARGSGLSMVSGFVVSQLAFVAGAADCVRGAVVTQWER